MISTPCRLAGYIEKFKASVNYGAFEKKGYPIGAGEGESLHRTLRQKRLKLPGAWWSECNINPMLALRVIRQNDWWDEFWAANHKRIRPIATTVN